MNQSKKLTHGALMISLFVVLLLVTFFVPFVSIITLFLLPVPFIVYASKYNWKSSIVILFAATIITVLFGTIFSIAIPIVMGIGGIMIGSAIYRNLSPYETLARGTFAFIIGLLFHYAAFQLLFQVNLVQELRAGVMESKEMSKAIFESVGVGNQSAAFEEIMEAQINYLIDLFPMFLIIAGFLFALLSQWVSYKLMNRTMKQDLYFPPFRTLRIPASLLWIYLITLFLSMMVLGGSGIFYVAVQNAQMLLSLLITIQGFSFIFYYSHHKKLSKFIPIMSIVLTIIFPPIFLLLVRLIGILDIGFNMRERMMRNR